MDSSRANPVLVIDFGAQYAQLIARRIRDVRAYSEIVPHSITAEQVVARGAAALILSGGPKSVWEPGAPSLDPAIYDLDIPILGICYGAQLMAQQLGGKVIQSDISEFGRTQLQRSIDHSTLLEPMSDGTSVWMSHTSAIIEPPTDALTTASTENAPVAAFEDVAKRRYGVQFHPEVSHTEMGTEVLSRFLFEGAGLQPRWTHFSIIEESVEQIRSTVGSAKVICALSGGVDSTVAAVLAYEAVGDQLTCVFVDTGLLREGEADQVETLFKSRFHIPFIRVDAGDRFFSNLAGVIDPEKKRTVIGETFIRVFEEVAPALEGARFLVQGTLYPDMIESGTQSAAKIKSHHNVGGLPEKMQFSLVEPLRYLFKDEVRGVGIELGIPESVVWRQPFPGPGLAVRILGEVNRENVQRVRAADRVVQEEIGRSSVVRSIWQAFAVLAPSLRSVGVSGDERTYDAPVILRAVESEDAMTADWARLPYEVLDRIARRIVGEVDGVNRVVYDITSKPPGTIEWE
ncbi:MAG: glutamine-hydrolyzing GMP synthase [Ferrimicrobium sp.]